MSDTIVTKSNQLNTDDFLAGDMVIKITKVVDAPGEDQKCHIFYEGDKGKPWKPCLTMQKLLMAGWGDIDFKEYEGRLVGLYVDKEVTFGKDTPGGIRVKAMSDLKESFDIRLVSTRGRKKLYRVSMLDAAPEYSQEKSDEIIALLMGMNKDFEAFSKVVHKYIGRSEKDVKKLTVKECDAVIKELQKRAKA